MEAIREFSLNDPSKSSWRIFSTSENAKWKSLKSVEPFFSPFGGHLKLRLSPNVTLNTFECSWPFWPANPFSTIILWNCSMDSAVRHIKTTLFISLSHERFFGADFPSPTFTEGKGRESSFKDIIQIIGTALCFLEVVFISIRELKHQTFLVPRTPTGSIFAAW